MEIILANDHIKPAYRTTSSRTSCFDVNIVSEFKANHMSNIGVPRLFKEKSSNKRHFRTILESINVYKWKIRLVISDKIS